MTTPIQSIRNPYRGINAHLHSRWQNRGGWNSFHTNHISDLARALKPVLAPLGYDAETEYSLQIRRPGDSPLRPRADVLVFDQVPGRVRPVSRGMGGAVAELELPMSAVLDLDDPEEVYSAVAIYPVTDGERDRGEPVAWIELLSPTNKPGGSAAEDYRAKRQWLLQSGLVVVEIDYLHESPPTIRDIPVYYAPGRADVPQPGAHAYHITVIDPHPALMQGRSRTTFMDVDDPLPRVTIPLAGADVLAFDFGAPYQRTLTELTYGRLVDYRHLPDHVERYSPADQARIAARMLAVLEAARAGRDLETDPLPTTPGELDDLLARLQQINEDA
jgi:hypothetical protein